MHPGVTHLLACNSPSNRHALLCLFIESLVLNDFPQPRGHGWSESTYPDHAGLLRASITFRKNHDLHIAWSKTCNVPSPCLQVRVSFSGCRKKVFTMRRFHDLANKSTIIAPLEFVSGKLSGPITVPTAAPSVHAVSCLRSTLALKSPTAR